MTTAVPCVHYWHLLPGDTVALCRNCKTAKLVAADYSGAWVPGPPRGAAAMQAALLVALQGEADHIEAAIAATARLVNQLQTALVYQRAALASFRTVIDYLTLPPEDKGVGLGETPETPETEQVQEEKEVQP